MSKAPQKHSHIKQRIIGAVMLIAVIVIFVPMLLQKSPSTTESIANLTQRPTIKQPNYLDKQDFATQSKLSETSLQPVAQAWVVQLGSFTKKSRAEALATQLRSHGYASYIYQVKMDKQYLTRVYVGPEVKKSRAKQLQQDLSTKLGLKGNVVAFSLLDS